MSRIGKSLCAALASLALAACAWTPAPPPAPGAAPAGLFDQVASLDEMRTLLAEIAPEGTSRGALRSLLAGEAGAARYTHPVQGWTEKYVYDIDLCRLHIWRWNVSADFDGQDRLVEIYLNGEPVFGEAPPGLHLNFGGGPRRGLMVGTRARPEADRGQSALTFLIVDLDSDPGTTWDQLVMGTGPVVADPARLGELHLYRGVERWRSIFDEEPAARIAPYRGRCP